MKIISISKDGEVFPCLTNFNVRTGDFIEYLPKTGNSSKTYIAEVLNTNTTYEDLKNAISNGEISSALNGSYFNYAISKVERHKSKEDIYKIATEYERVSQLIVLNFKRFQGRIARENLEKLLNL